MLAGLPDVPKDSKWSERQKQECKKLVIFHLDFNVPGVPQEHFNLLFRCFGHVCY